MRSGVLIILLGFVLILVLSQCNNPAMRVDNIREEFAKLEPRLAREMRGSDGSFKPELTPDLREAMNSIHKRWSYVPEAKFYSVTFGNYNSDGFYLHWNSLDREWKVDQ